MALRRARAVLLLVSAAFAAPAAEPALLVSASCTSTPTSYSSPSLEILATSVIAIVGSSSSTFLSITRSRFAATVTIESLNAKTITFCNEALRQHKETKPCNYDDAAPGGPLIQDHTLRPGNHPGQIQGGADRCGHAVPRIGRLNSDIESAQDNRVRLRSSNAAAKRTRQELSCKTSFAW